MSSLKLLRSKTSGAVAAAIAVFAVTYAPTAILAEGLVSEDSSYDASLDHDIIERIYVVGSSLARMELPGAAEYLDADDLAKFEYSDIHRLLRQVPGINIQEEDGWGLRPNIGIRGAGIERSERITLMEDGVLIAPAPYAAPAAYYFPTAGRLEAVEVRKGSSAIKFGPRTTGGAINLVSTSIPDERGGLVTARIGEFGFREMHAVYGGDLGPIAGVIETFQSGADGFKVLPDGASGNGDTGFRIEDYMAKLRVGHTGQTADNGRAHWIEFKFALTDQESDESYLGLTDADFAANPYQRYAASALDQFTSEHRQVQATHYVELSDAVDLTTRAYYNAFERDWFKLDDLDFGDGRGRIRPGAVFADPSNPLNVSALAILRGEANSIDDAIQLRHNAREYESYGVQAIVGIQFASGAAEHDVEIGVRYHGDEEDRLQNREKFRMEAGQLVETSVDAPGSQGNRVARARALAVYVQDEIEWGRLRLIPGARFEHIKLERIDYSQSDPERTLGAIDRRENTVDAFMPGLGASWEWNDNLTLIAGVHRGFSPPGPSNASADAEKSVNYEAGLRYDGGNGFAEVIGFYNDYSNLLGTCSNATGCVGGDVGDQFNGGAVNVVGVEASAEYDIPLASILDGLTMPVRVAYTYTDASFTSDFSDGFWGGVVDGDALPYIPRHQVFASVGVEAEAWSLRLAMNHVGTTRSRAGQGAMPQLERIGSRTLFDAAASWNVRRNVRLFASVENLADAVYVAARRPYGARPGKPRSLMAGLSIDF